MKIFGSITELLNLVLRKDTRAITVRPNQTVTYTADRDVQLPPQNADAVLVSETATQTLTNKTVDGDNNTVQDLPVTAIKTVLGDANKVLLRDASGVVTSALVGDSNLATGIDAAKIDGGLVSNTEFNYLDGVTSAIQTQLDAKVDENAAIVGATNTKITYDSKGLVTSGTALAASDLPTGIDATKIADGSVTSTEFQYINTVTSNVQTQLNSKASNGANSDITSLSGLTTALSIPQGGTGQTTAQTARNALLPTQTSNTNRFLRTDGTDVSWASTGGGVGKNYLQDQYDADSAISVQQSVGDVLASSTRLNPTFFGSSSAVSNLISVSADTSLRPTNNYLIAFASNGQFIETPLFSLDGIDLGKAMAVSFAVTGVGAADDVQTYMARYNSSNVLQERIPIAGIASATTPNSAQVPTGTTTFRGFFLPSSTAGDKYALRILRNANNTSMRIDALVVGPNGVMTGTGIQDMQSAGVVSLTAASGGLVKGTTTLDRMSYARVGDRGVFRIEYMQSATGTAGTGEYIFTLPNNLSIDTTKVTISSPTPDQNVLGFAQVRAGANYFTGVVTPNNSTSVKLFVSNDSTALTTVGSTFCGVATATIRYFAEFSVPITGWSSNVTMADRAVEEYASNGGAAGVSTSDTADFKYGPAGFQIGSITAQISRRVRFQTVVQATDSLIVEVSTDRIIWSPMNNTQIVNGTAINPYNTQSSVTYGYGRIAPFSSTDVDIAFGQYAQNAGAYAGAGTAWSSGAGSGYWRVRKVSGGAAVGYPIGARNVIGDVSGTAVPAGYIGESTFSQGTNSLLTSGTALLIQTYTLPSSGVWMITCSAAFSGSATSTSHLLSINTANAFTTAPSTTASYTNTGGPGDDVVVLQPLFVSTATAPVVYVYARGQFTGGNLSAQSAIKAVRIA